MFSVNLSDQLSGHVLQFLFVFTRLGVMVMLLPGIGEAYVPSRVRMLFALALSFLLMPVLMPLVPKVPNDNAALVMLLASEVLAGVFVGSVLRLLVSAVETAGAVIAVQIGLSNAMILNPALAVQSALPSAFLGAVGVMLLFVTGLDHLMLRGLLDTYDLFPPGKPLLMGDMTEAYTLMLGKSFTVGVEIAAPFLIIGLLLFVALGLMQRMVAQVQLFMVTLPIQIVGGMVLFAATISMMLTAWLKFFDASLTGLMVR